MTMRQACPRIKRAVAAGTALALLAAGGAAAHVSEQGFVLLLPTDVYIGAGVATVAATVLLLAVLPARMAGHMFRPVRLWPRPGGRLRDLPALASSWLSVLLLAALVWIGLGGARDPLVNPLPLAIWTVWWIALVTLQGLTGVVWHWLDPWRGPVTAVRAAIGPRPPLPYPGALGHGLGILAFLLFAGVLLADPAPADPGRLAALVAGYWAYGFAGRVLFGPRFALRADGIAMLMSSYGRLGILGAARGRRAAALPGWQVLRRGAVPSGMAVFALLLLGSGSFDGVNETFLWLSLLGINPLEFPGRSAVIAPTLIGLAAANLALVSVFAATIWLGMRLARAGHDFGATFRLFAPSVLPIALGYHVAHYLTAFLVDGQYALAAASDPLTRGDDILGLGTFYVTTGFFNTRETVRAIWLTQAGAVVAGHVLAILLAHALAVRAYGTARRAALSQAPLAAFMVLYTLFGLWLLAAPRGA